MKVIGKVSGANLQAAYAVAQDIGWERVVHSSYAPKRLEKWYRYSSNLQSIKLGRGVIERQHDPHPRLVALGDRLYPGWHSLLACYGNLEESSSTTITPHRDHGHFEGIAYMLNLGVAVYREQPLRDNDRWVEYTLTDGMVVEIDTKLIHEAVQISQIRYNFTFRKLKPQYLA